MVDIFFTACSKSGTCGESLTIGPNWTLTLDGKNYNWAGSLPTSANNSGVSAYISSSGLNQTATMSMASSLVSGSYPQNISVQLSSVNTVTFRGSILDLNGGMHSMSGSFNTAWYQ